MALVEATQGNRGAALAHGHALQHLGVQNGTERTSTLPAPTMLYRGHEGEVFSVEFSPDGSNIATGGFDKSVLISAIYGEGENWCVLKGHTNAVLEVHWSPDSSKIASCSADNMVALWDVESGKRIKKFSGHTAVVNSCNVNRRGTSLIVSGADDGTVKVWDMRVRRCIKTFEHQYQILGVTFDDAAERIFAGSLDNTVRVYNMVSDREEAIYAGHADCITGVDVSRDGSCLLTNSMDQSIRCWDIRPYFVGESRCTQIFTGPTHNFEKNLLRVRWSPNGKKFAAGSADKMTYVWDVEAKEVQYRLPGHQGSVNEVCFHPSEPIIASASSDKQVFVGELC